MLYYCSHVLLKQPIEKCALVQQIYFTHIQYMQPCAEQKTDVILSNLVLYGQCSLDIIYRPGPVYNIILYIVYVIQRIRYAQTADNIT